MLGLSAVILRVAWASQGAQVVKNLPAKQETRVRSLGGDDALGKKWQPTPVFLPGESHGQRSLVGVGQRSPWGRRVGLNLAIKQQQNASPNYGYLICLEDWGWPGGMERLPPGHQHASHSTPSLSHHLLPASTWCRCDC